MTTTRSNNDAMIFQDLSFSSPCHKKRPGLFRSLPWLETTDASEISPKRSGKTDTNDRDGDGRSDKSHVQERPLVLVVCKQSVNLKPPWRAYVPSGSDCHKTCREARNQPNQDGRADTAGTRVIHTPCQFRGGRTMDFSNGRIAPIAS